LVSLCANDPRFQKHHLSSLKYIGVGAAPLGESALKRLESKAPDTVIIEGKFSTDHFLIS
jgi:hypothetical protein